MVGRRAGQCGLVWGTSVPWSWSSGEYSQIPWTESVCSNTSALSKLRSASRYLGRSGTVSKAYARQQCLTHFSVDMPMGPPPMMTTLRTVDLAREPIPNSKMVLRQQLLTVSVIDVHQTEICDKVETAENSKWQRRGVCLTNST